MKRKQCSALLANKGPNTCSKGRIGRGVPFAIMTILHVPLPIATIIGLLKA